MEGKINQYFGDENLKGNFQGTVLVAKEEKIIFEKGFGYADLEKRKKNQIDTIYTIGSLTKAFIAVLILILEQEGYINITDNISKYLAHYKWGQCIQIKNLLNHTSGIWCYLRDMNETYWPDAQRYHSVEEVYQFFKEKDLIFKPGTQYSYTNSGYVLLGMIIEKITGMSIADFLEYKLFIPLNIKNSYYDPNEKRINELEAIGYNYPFLQSKKPAPKLHVSMTYTSGGIKSNVKDLFKWIRALQTSFFIKKETNSMFVPGLGNYGYAWWIDEIGCREKRDKNIWHWGCTSGYHGIISYLEKEQISVVILQNTTSPNLTCPEYPEVLLKHRNQVYEILMK